MKTNKEYRPVFRIDHSKIHRIDAILAEPGILGCGRSHKKAVEYVIAHPEWNRVLILEDDFTFHSNTSREILDAISTICSVTPPFDVALLSHNHTNLQNRNSILDIRGS